MKGFPFTANVSTLVAAIFIFAVAVVHGKQYLRKDQNENSKPNLDETSRKTQAVTNAASCNTACVPSGAENPSYQYASVCVERAATVPVTTCLPTQLVGLALQRSNTCGACPNDGTFSCVGTDAPCTTDNGEDGFYYCSTTFQQEICISNDHKMFSWMEATGFCGRCPDADAMNNASATDNAMTFCDFDDSTGQVVGSETCALDTNATMIGRKLCWTPGEGMNITADEMTICVLPSSIPLLVPESASCGTCLSDLGAATAISNVTTIDSNSTNSTNSAGGGDGDKKDDGGGSSGGSSSSSSSSSKSSSSSSSSSSSGGSSGGGSSSGGDSSGGGSSGGDTGGGNSTGTGGNSTNSPNWTPIDPQTQGPTVTQSPVGPETESPTTEAGPDDLTCTDQCVDPEGGAGSLVCIDGEVDACVPDDDELKELVEAGAVTCGLCEINMPTGSPTPFTSVDGASSAPFDESSATVAPVGFPIPPGECDDGDACEDGHYICVKVPDQGCYVTACAPVGTFSDYTCGECSADDECVPNTDEPTKEPSPTPDPTPLPTEGGETNEPTLDVTADPTLSSTPGPTTEELPTESTESPVESPSESTESPVESPTEPTESPVEEPTESPVEEPTEPPADEPTESPAEAPTDETRAPRQLKIDIDSHDNQKFII